MTGRILQNVIAVGTAGLLMAGCASPGRLPAGPETPRPLGMRYPAAALAESGRTGAANPPDTPAGIITLEQALACALLRNPELEAYAYGARAAEARLLQAGALPNPKLEFEADEYDRGGAGFNSVESAVVLAQAFELGGKRQWRRRAAAAEGELAGWEYADKRIEVLTETARRFTDVLAAQERLALARAAVALAEQTSGAVAERVQAGKEPPLQAAKSGAELELVRLEALASAQELDLACRRLAAMWGAETAAFHAAAGRLDRIPDAVPDLAALRPRLEANPALARWDAALRLRRAALASAQAARIPDVEAAVGYQQFEEDGTDAFAFGVGLPLPLFDRNRGNIAAARHELDRAERERAAAEVALAAELAGAHARLSTAHARVGTLQAKVVPAMEQACAAAQEGYRQGKFGFLDLLDAQRSLFEARQSLVDALADYHAALIAIQRITVSSNDDKWIIAEKEDK